jgi:hypothetical protein
MAWEKVGDAGDTTVEVDKDAGNIALSQYGRIFLFNVIDAAYLAVLLDEAIAMAKGQAVKLNEDDGA